MTENTVELKCPRCGAVLDVEVANGICPACLLKQAALGTGADSFPAMPWTPPSVAELAAAFPQLEVLKLIGHGGMGAVYKARQKSLGRLVALKILAPQHAANPDFAERFAREAKVLAEVSHPNIVTVHDFGQTGEFYFLTMEFVDGVNLRQAMTAGRLTPQQALAIVPPICEALQFAHDRGIVHRDIKPENLLLDKEGRIKIADFGIARMLRADGSHAHQSVCENESASAHALASVATKPDLTQESVLGTPSYMAPEQRERPASVDHRADIFSLGVVLYEMLTGELPGSKLQPPSKKVQIDVRLDEVVLRALEQQPELRFQTASEFRTQVTTFVQDSATGPSSKPIGGLPLRSDGHFTTPERLKTFWGQLFFHHYGAQFSINAQQLTIRHGGVLVPSQEISIPLAAIQDVSVGRYPALVNLHGLDYVQVTYEQEGETKRLYFTPRPDRWTPLSGVNQHVSEWCEAIRAVKDGREPVIKATVGPSSASNPAVSPHERQRGFLFLALSVFFVLMFLLGGGVVTSSNGGYWTAVFFAAFVTGLLFPGILVYRSAVASACNVASPTPVRTNRSLLVQRLGSSLFLAISGPAWFYFFRSRAFGSSIGQHTFLIFMGFALAQFIPLGLGFIHRERRQSGGNEKPLDVIPAKWSQRQAMGLVACFFGLTILLDLVRWPAAGSPARSFEEFAGLCFAVCVLMAIVMGGVAASLRLLQASRQGDIEPDRAKSWWCLRAAAAGGTTPRSAMLRLLLAACLVIVVMWLAVRGVWTNSSATEVTIRQAAVENGHFTFGYSVQNVPGWNVWLTLENAQLFTDDGSTDKPTEPVIVSRYQAKLTGNGRVRVPLEYRPASDEGRSAVTLPPPEGHVFSIGLNHGASLLAYQTESHMRVWAIVTVLPEGQTPDSLLINEPTGSPASPRYKTVEPPAVTSPMVPDGTAVTGFSPSTSAADGDTILFSGQVLDAETQRPVAGAEIISRFREYDWEKQAALARADGQRIPLLAERRVTTDADGHFPVILPMACEGRDVAIERSVWHRDFVIDRSFGDWVVLKSERDSAETQKKLGSIKLKRGFVVTGQVLDVDGSPARNVPIQVAMQYPEYLGFAPLARTDDAGRYQVRVPSRDEHRVFVMPTHAIPQSRPITKGYGEQPVVRLEPGVRIRGRVLDVAGRGVRDVVVQGNGDDSVYHGLEKPLVRVRTNPEGRFELPPLLLGTDVRVISEGWTGAWQRKGEKLPDVYLPTFAVFSPDQLKPTETTVPLEEINIDFTPVSSVKLTARCFNVDGTPGDVNAEFYGLSPKSERQRWRGRFDPVANQPGLFELRVPKGLTHAALDLMHDGRFKFNDATRAAPPTETQKTVRTGVRYEIINDDDNTIEIRASASK